MKLKTIKTRDNDGAFSASQIAVVLALVDNMSTWKFSSAKKRAVVNLLNRARELLEEGLPRKF